MAQSLAKFNIFEDFRDNAEVLERIKKISKPCEFEPDKIILQEGTSGSEMYLLMKGEAAVYKKTPSGDEYKVANLNEHMNVIFGEGALLDVDTRSATVRAITQCKCYSIDRTDFEEFSLKYPEVALPILRKIARSVMARFRKTNQDFLLVYNALVAEIRGR